MKKERIKKKKEGTEERKEEKRQMKKKRKIKPLGSSGDEYSGLVD